MLVIDIVGLNLLSDATRSYKILTVVSSNLSCPFFDLFPTLQHLQNWYVDKRKMIVNLKSLHNALEKSEPVEAIPCAAV